MMLLLKLYYPQFYTEQFVSDKIEFLGMGKYVGYIVISTVLLHFGFPRLIVEGVAGMLFGFIEGVFWSQFVCIIVAYSHFQISKHSDLKFLKLNETIRNFKLDRLKSSATSVFLSRLLPVPCIIINFMLGKLKIKDKDYLIGSYIGFLTFFHNKKVRYF